MCLDYAKHFYDILGDCVYAMDADSLEEVVVKELAARGLTVATAESCTGGMLSQRITAVPGRKRCVRLRRVHLCKRY